MKYLLKAIGIMAMMNAGVWAAPPCTPVVTISSDITTNTTFTNTSIYRIQGCVRVTTGVTLTINAGAVITFDNNDFLEISRGATLNAIGTPANPITFTAVGAPGSRSIKTNAGVVIAGDAQVNTGSLDLPCTPFFAPGSTNTGSSGTLQYVQVHFLSGSSTLDFMTNALTLVGVGSGTTIDHIEITHSAGSGLGIIGGRPTVENLFVMNTARNDIYISLGAQTSLEEVLAIHKDCALHSNNGTNGLFIENNPVSPLDTPFTMANINHASFIGPLHCDCSPHNDFQHGVYLDHNAGINMSNSLVTGYNGYGFYLEDESSVENTDNGRVQLNYTSFTNNGIADYGHNPLITWSGTGCGSNMTIWITGGAPCTSEENQFSPFDLGYDASFCEDYCDELFEPDFVLTEATELEPTEAGILERGAVQFDELFAWIDVCPQNRKYCDSVLVLQVKAIENFLNIYPNPARQQAYLNFKTQTEGTVYITIYEVVTGRELHRQTVQILISGEQHIPIPLTGLTEGVYPVRILMEDQVIQGKINVK